MDEPLQQLTDISTDAVIRRRTESDRWIEAAYSPGRAVLITCLLVDFVLFPVILMLILALEWMVGRDLLFWLFDLLFMPVMLAQATMLAIWLGVVVPMLYWLLLICFAIPVEIGILSSQLPAEPTLILLLYPLPFAMASAFDLKVVPIPKPDYAEIARPVRFSLLRLFFWTFIAGVVFGFLRLVPMQTFFPELLAWIALWIVTGFLCVLAVLRLGSNRFTFLWAVGIAGLLGLLTSTPFRPRMNQVFFAIVHGSMHALCLSGLLMFYRRAGYRAVWRRGYYPEPERKPVREPVNPLAD